MHEALPLFKLLADDTRLRILQALSEKEMYTELLAERLQLTPATVSFHMKKLQTAGLVDARREQYYTVYSLRNSIFSATLSSLIFKSESDTASEQMREEMYRRKILKAFMPDGYCKVMPAQVKKRMVIYDEIFRQFDPSRTYLEKEVNEIIGRMHEDYCTVRRMFVGMGWMQRANGVYTINPDPDRSGF